MFPYIYFWNRMGRKGQRCRVLVRGRMNSCLVEFEDGYQAVTSRNALRKAAKWAGHTDHHTPVFRTVRLQTDREGAPPSDKESIRGDNELRNRLLQFGLMPAHADDMIMRPGCNDASISFEMMG